jgi:tetratricopeptide (TPR) repeat protein
MINSFATVIEASAFALIFALQYLTPTNLRSARATFAQCKTEWQASPTRRDVVFLTTGLVLALALLLTPTVGAQPVADNAATAPVAATAALPPDIMKLRDEGNAAIFNVDYQAARAKFEAIQKQLPLHPAGDLYVAIATWLESLYRSRRLQTSLYREDSNFYAGADKKDEKTEGDAVDPAVDKAFRERIQSAKLKALTLVNKDKKDPHALYFLGAVHAIIASYEASTARKFFAAMRNGSRAVDLHQKTLELKPDYYDAYLSIGTYHFVLGKLPWGLKALAAIGGMRGNKQKGIAEIQSVIDKGTNADDARVVLLAIYQIEKRPEEALAILGHLAEKYPRNALFRLEHANSLIGLKRFEQAYQVFESLLKDPIAAGIADLAHYQYGEALAANKEYAKAAAQFLAVAQTKTAEDNLTTVSLLRAAQVYDLAGKRDEALAQYKAVLARPNVYDTREQAERGLKQVYVPVETNKKGDE